MLKNYYYYYYYYYYYFLTRADQLRAWRQEKVGYPVSRIIAY